MKEFGVDTDEPDLFNTENQDNTSNDLLSTLSDENEEDDLEIPAFFEKTKKLMVFKKINVSHHGIGCSKTLSGTA